MKTTLTRHTLALLCAAHLATVASSQNESFVPAACRDLPGNAALSLPLRWSHGTLQMRINATMLPANFIGKTITGLRMRRPAFLGEPAYGALQRTLTVRAGFDNRPAINFGSDLLVNRPATAPVVFGPAVVPVPATAAHGPATDIGDDLISIQFTTPMLVIAGNLFLEFEATDGPMQVLPNHWVDAVWFPGGVESGYAVQVGDGSCTTRPEPTELSWNDPGAGPVVGGTAALKVTGAAPAVGGGTGTMVFVWFGFDPQPRAVTVGYMGYGNSLAPLDPTLAACHQWAPLDFVWNGTSDAGGAYVTTFDLVASATTIGLRIGVQSAWLDDTRPGLPISVSNGLMLQLNGLNVGTDCSTQFFPGALQIALWPTFRGQMPVLALEHN